MANEYEDIAINFLKYKNINKTIIHQDILIVKNVDVAYLFSLSDKGYILVPISKNSSPIKAYSFKRSFDALPNLYKEFLLNQLYSILLNKTLLKTTNTNISNRWTFLGNYTTSAKKVLYSYLPNTNLLTTSWNQTYPYNKFFPKVGGELTLAGCVQVAMGQIMKYHKYPSRGKGSIQNSINVSDINGIQVRTDNLKTILNKNYNWDIMPDDTFGMAEYQNDELAYLMRDLSIVNSADMGVLVTAAYANIEALVSNYGYSNEIQRMQSYGANYRGEFVSNETLISTMKEQIDLELPVLFSLPGHMVVADGYQDDSTGGYIHLNMGWGGASDDYYNIDETVVIAPYSFASTYDIVYNIKPCSESKGDCNIIDTVDTNSYPPIIDQSLDDKVIITDTKILINAYDENDEDNISFKAFSNNSNINVSFDKNILSIIPNVNRGHSIVKVSVSSNNDIVEKEFNILINDEKIHFGQEYTIENTFTSQDEFDKHRVVLDGVCEVSGFNGYTNQAFFTSLMDINENYLINMNDNSFTSSNLDLDFYLIGASLKQNISNGGLYYPYDVNNSNYTLSVSCPNADESIINIANLLNITIDNTTPNPKINLKPTWNLVSADISLDTINSTIRVIWKYINDTWKVYAPTLNIENYQTIEKISANHGTWILSSIDQNISIDDNTTELNYSYSNGWTLNGTNKDINVSEISCNNGELQNIWKYSNNSWQLYTALDTEYNFEIFNTIKKNEGFWISCL